MKVYIAGPMRGRPSNNFPAFDAARDWLRRQGWEVISPADLDRAKGMTSESDPSRLDWHDLMHEDLSLILTEVDALCVLPGWDRSEGASAEVVVARATGLPVFPVDETVLPR